jgi:carboxyl-terminal processing protease
MFYRPGGVSTQHVGVESDVTVPTVFATEDIGESALDYPLPPNKITPFLGSKVNAEDKKDRWTPITSDIVQKLATASKERIDKNDEFKKIATKIKEANDKKDVIKLSELRKKMNEDKEKDELASDSKGKKKGKIAKSKKKAKDKEDEPTPQYKEALNILGDFLAASPAQALPSSTARAN